VKSGDLSLDGYPVLRSIVSDLDKYLASRYPDFFGPTPTHPCLSLKSAKVIHDNLWGTSRFSWVECLILDSPLLQRLRDIHQVGFAHHVYPGAHHTRFEHSLGVLTLASRTFDACLERSRGDFKTVASQLYAGQELTVVIARLRQELRLAALLHDIGHSLYSHTSERVYSRLDLLKTASNELGTFTGKEKGAGEVLSFCLANTAALKTLLDRGRALVSQTASYELLLEPISLANVSLIIVGRSAHPYLQFLGDIVSSAFDADKLDYLLRDATAAGLPLKYDLDRYLYGVKLHKAILDDGDGLLGKLYSNTGAGIPPITPAGYDPDSFDNEAFPYFETYRLRLPRNALNAIEQIVICKMMLFSYLYHHGKVRASEGLFELMLSRAQDGWLASGLSESDTLCRYLDFTDAALSGEHFLGSKDPIVSDYAYRLQMRLLPREIYRINSTAASHAERLPLGTFLDNLQDSRERPRIIQDFRDRMGAELSRLDPKLGSPQDALYRAGIWLDVPKAPKFDDVDELTISSDSGGSGGLKKVFPIDKWTQAYTAYTYNVRVFAFSEFMPTALAAGRKVLEDITKISSDDFFGKIKRTRE
jgi:uncharacterized protein